MIDPDRETIVSLGDAARNFPGGERHIGTVHRYRLRGVCNVHLECIRVGGRWYTSWESISRFIGRLNPDSSDAKSDGTVLTGSDGLADIEKDLDRAGL